MSPLSISPQGEKWDPPPSLRRRESNAFEDQTLVLGRGRWPFSRILVNNKKRPVSEDNEAFHLLLKILILQPELQLSLPNSNRK